MFLFRITIRPHLIPCYCFVRLLIELFSTWNKGKNCRQRTSISRISRVLRIIKEDIMCVNRAFNFAYLSMENILLERIFFSFFKNLNCDNAFLTSVNTLHKPARAVWILISQERLLISTLTLGWPAHRKKLAFQTGIEKWPVLIVWGRDSLNIEGSVWERKPWLDLMSIDTKDQTVNMLHPQGISMHMAWPCGTRHSKARLV